MTLQNEKRRIAIITATRAEYGLLYWLMKEIQSDPDLELQLIVTGAHLSPEFGQTWKEIRADGFSIDRTVEMLLSGDSTVAVTKSLGIGLLGFAEAFEELKPDVLIILGDRYEMLGAAAAGNLAGIPIAHIHGGEVTLGAYDDSFRHAITKMSSLHFVANKVYRDRVIQMGELPESVFVVGPACVDSLLKQELPSQEALATDLGIVLDTPLLLITYHPETRSPIPSEEQIDQLLSCLGRFAHATMVFTGVNADTDGRVINDRVIQFCAKAPKQRVFVQSLGRERYWGMLALADVVIGNSSSGVIEAPLMGVSVVNVGGRQAGRIKDDLVIDCACEENAIDSAIRLALDQVRTGSKRLNDFTSPARSMAQHLKTFVFKTPKNFYDILWRTHHQ